MRKVIVLTACLMFVGVTSNFAESLKTHTWDLGTELSYIKYEEPDVMEEDGMMYGMFGSYTYRDDWMLRAEGKWSYGQVDYDGRLNTGADYTVSGINDYMLEFRGVGGYDFSVSETTSITPYTGFGYRYLFDGLGTDVFGYDRESSYYYSPIGIETNTVLDDGWSIGTVVEFDYFWKGVQTSNLSDLNASFNDVENDQNEGYGIRGSIKLRKEGDTVDFLIEPFIRYWNISESETASVTVSGTYTGVYIYEPKNNSIEFGAKFALNF